MPPIGERRKVFITVKTYPTLSEKYNELVCTAGILDNGSWVRVHPLPFRKLEYEKRYKKYQWIELDLVKNTEDPRPESHRVVNIDNISTGKLVGTAQQWLQRREIIFASNPVFDDLGDLISKAHNNELSLAIFKPAKIHDFVVEQVTRSWSDKQLKLLAARARQVSMFQTEAEVRREFLVVNKLPYKFSYKFSDSKGKPSKLMIEDWEIGMLYWNCLKQSEGNEGKAIALVRQKYFDKFRNTDLHVFLGTTRRYHSWASNPFVIVGVFYPPKINQPSLF